MSHERHEPGVKTYTLIYFGLLILMTATVAAAFYDFNRILPGHSWGMIIAFAIASVKGLLIVLYFMHVLSGPRRAAVFAGAGFLWLGILFVLIFCDYASRQYPVNPRGEPRYIWQNDPANAVHPTEQASHPA